MLLLSVPLHIREQLQATDNENLGLALLWHKLGKMEKGCKCADEANNSTHLGNSSSRFLF